MPPSDRTSRRAFLAFVAASPLFAAAGVERTTVARLFAGSRRDQSEALTLVDQATQDAALISSPGEALNVFDFEPVARARIPVAPWGYLMTGTDDATLRANRDGFSRYALRARRLVDVSRIGPSIERLGVRWGTPTWDFVRRLRGATTMKVLVKGIVTREDAEIAMEHGVDGLFVSNHGGRAENSQRATIECLPEVVAGIKGRATTSSASTPRPWSSPASRSRCCPTPWGCARRCPPGSRRRRTRIQPTSASP